MPSKGQDFNKIKRIMKVLLRNPDGIWLRKLSRDSKIPLSTVHYYLERYLNNMINNVGARDEEGKFFGVRVIKLRNGVFNQLSSGNFESNLKKLLKTSEILSNFE